MKMKSKIAVMLAAIAFVLLGCEQKTDSGMTPATTPSTNAPALPSTNAPAP